MSPNWQKTPKPPMRHVAKPGEAGRSVVTSLLIYKKILEKIYQKKKIKQFLTF